MGKGKNRTREKKEKERGQIEYIKCAAPYVLRSSDRRAKKAGGREAGKRGQNPKNLLVHNVLRSVLPLLLILALVLGANMRECNGSVELS